MDTHPPTSYTQVPDWYSQYPIFTVSRTPIPSLVVRELVRELGHVPLLPVRDHEEAHRLLRAPPVHLVDAVKPAPLDLAHRALLQVPHVRVPGGDGDRFRDLVHLERGQRKEEKGLYTCRAVCVSYVVTVYGVSVLRSQVSGLSYTVSASTV